MTTCSVVIPVHNRAALTGRCVDAVLATQAEGVSEVVVVDDASSDTTAAMLAKRAQDVVAVRHERNLGFAASCNDGVAAASGDWIVLLNNDAIPEPGWLSSLLAYASGRERAGAVGAKLLFPDRTIQHAGVVFARELTPQHIYLGFPWDHPAVEKSREFQAVTGACLLVRRELFLELGGLDRAFLNGYEDLDFCCRLREAGQEVHYCHDSVLTHLESATRASDPRSVESNARNHVLFLDRWADFLFRDDVSYYVQDGLIDFTYPGQFPVIARVSPRLAVLHPERRSEAERLLAERSRQVYEGLKENAQLRMALLEASSDRSRREDTEGDFEHVR